ncbi:MAG: YcbK family protein [Rhizobiaceae bacterium]
MSAHVNQLLKSAARAVPVMALVFLASCTSTGSNLDAASASLQPGLNSTTPSNSQQNLQPAPTGVAVNLATPQDTAAGTDGQIQVAAAPGETQLDQNSKLVAAAAAAASENSGTKATTPVLTTPAAQSAAVDGATNPPASETFAPASSAEPVVAAVADPAAANSAANQVANSEAAPAPAKAADAASTEAEPTAKKPTAQANAAPAEEAIAAAPAEAAPAPAPAKKKSLFDALFASNKKPAAQAAEEAAPAMKLALAEPTPVKAAKVAVEPALQPAKLDLSKLEQPQEEAQGDAPANDNGELPGVRKGALFEIKRRDSLQDDTDVDIGETDSGPILLASAGGLARLAPNGLKVQRESVDVACLKPQLVKILKKIEKHYNSSVVVTSGYRSPGYNRRVRGAKNSLHMFCAAADIQVVGVSKWELARYARSMPDRGGVGTYCHTESIHIDVGPDRDWNWRCARRKK